MAAAGGAAAAASASCSTAFTCGAPLYMATAAGDRYDARHRTAAALALACRQYTGGPTYESTQQAGTRTPPYLRRGRGTLWLHAPVNTGPHDGAHVRREERLHLVCRQRVVHLDGRDADLLRVRATARF